MVWKTIRKSEKKSPRNCCKTLGLRVGWGVGIGWSSTTPSPGRGFLVGWGKDIVGSPFTTTVQPGPTSAAGEPNKGSPWEKWQDNVGLHHENPLLFFWEKGWWVEIWNATKLLGDEMVVVFFVIVVASSELSCSFWQKKNPSLEGWHVLQITQVFLCYESTSAVCFSIPKGGQLDHWHWLAICGSWGWGARVTPSRNDVVQTSAMTDHTNDKLVYQVFLFKAKQWKLVVVNAMSSFWVLKHMQCDCCCFLHGDVRFIGSGRLFCDLAWCAVEPQAVGHVRT